MKKRSERCRHCAPAAVPHRCTESAMAVVRHSQNSPPPQTPFPGAQDRQNLISWRRSPPAPTDPVWWRSMHAISSYRGNRHRPPATNTQTHRQDRLQYTAPLASTQCKYDDDDDRLARYLWQASFAEKRGRSVSVCETWHWRVIVSPGEQGDIHSFVACSTYGIFVDRLRHSVSKASMSSLTQLCSASKRLRRVCLSEIYPMLEWVELLANCWLPGLSVSRPMGSLVFISSVS